MLDNPALLARAFSADRGDPNGSHHPSSLARCVKIGSAPDLDVTRRNTASEMWLMLPQVLTLARAPGLDRWRMGVIVWHLTRNGHFPIRIKSCDTSIAKSYELAL